METIKGNKIKEKAEEIFSTESPKEWTLVQIIYDNYVSENGDVRRRARVGLKAIVDSLNYYIWRIPLVKEEQEVCGISVHDTEGLLSYDTIEDEGVITLKIKFPEIKKEEEKTLFLEYYVTNYASIFKKSIFSTKWNYSWNYRVLSKTERFKTNIYLPSNAKIENIETNATDEPIQFRYENEHIIILSQHEEMLGDLYGDISYVLTAPMTNLVFGVFGGAIMTVLIALLQIMNISLKFFTIYSFIILFVATVLIITFAKKYS